MKELIQSRLENQDLIMILQISAGAKEFIQFSDEPLHNTKKKRLANTSKTGLKLHQKLFLIPSSELTGYRKSYLTGLLRVDRHIATLQVKLWVNSTLGAGRKRRK